MYQRKINTEDFEKDFNFQINDTVAYSGVQWGIVLLSSLYSAIHWGFSASVGLYSGTQW